MKELLVSIVKGLVDEPSAIDVTVDEKNEEQAEYQKHACYREYGYYGHAPVSSELYERLLDCV